MLLKWYKFKTSVLKRREEATEEVPQERLTERLYKRCREKAEIKIKDSDLPNDPDGSMYMYFEQKFMNRCFRFGPLSWGIIIDKFCTLMLANFVVFAQSTVIFVKLGVTELLSAFISFPLSFVLIGLGLYIDYVFDLKTIAECEVVLDILSARRDRQNCYHFM